MKYILVVIGLLTIVGCSTVPSGGVVFTEEEYKAKWMSAWKSGFNYGIERLACDKPFKLTKGIAELKNESKTINSGS